MAVALALIAAFFGALGSVLMHRGISGKPMRQALLSWWVISGLLVLIPAWAFRSMAVGAGKVVVVQAVIVSALIFILPLSWLINREVVSKRDCLGALVTGAGIALFIVAAHPTEPTGGGQAAIPIWLAVLAGCVVCLALTTVLGRRLASRAPAVAAIIMGISAGLITTLAVTIMKAALLQPSPWSSWQMYVGITVIVLSAVPPLLAFQAGPITAAQPAINLGETVTGCLLGWILFGELLQPGVGWYVLDVVGLLVMGVGLVILSRGPAATESEGVAEAESAVIASLEREVHSRRGPGEP